MKRLICLIIVITMFSSCGVTSLYYWGGTQNGVTTYENLAYKDYKTQTPDAVCKLICVYQDIVTHPKGTRMVPPPGICAEYGYLLLQPDTPDIFAEYATMAQRKSFDGDAYAIIFPELGAKMLEAEINHYPEAAVFITPILNRYRQ